MNKAIFLDRDGVINENGSRISKPADLKILPGVPEAIKKINDSGFLAIVVTNQPEIAKGFYTLEDLEALHAHLRRELKKRGAHIDAFYVCPHHPEKGFPGEVAELKIDCECRKPKPGMLLQAIKEHKIDPEQSWMIGDSKGDVLAGQAAGVRTILLTSGGGAGSATERAIEKIKPDLSDRDLHSAVNRLFSHR